MDRIDLQRSGIDVVVTDALIIDHPILWCLGFSSALVYWFDPIVTIWQVSKPPNDPVRD